MKNHFDVIIVGGGPGGSSTATFLAKKGLKVALVEKASYPRDKVCGDGVPFPAIDIVERLGVFDEIPRLGYRIEAITVSSPNGNQFKVRAAKWVDGSIGYIVPRNSFDELLFCNAFQCGATGFENFCVDAIIKGASHSQKWQVRSSDGRLLSSNFLIGADGAHSAVARTLGLFEKDYKHEMVAIRGYFDDVSSLERNIELHFSSKTTPGYFWIFPTGERSANIGLITTRRELQKLGGNLKSIFYEVSQSHYPIKNRLHGSRAISEIRGWPLPLGSKFGRCFDDSVLLVGDAARLIDPTTGEGIYYALKSGEIAANVAFDALSEGKTAKEDLAIYRQRLIKEFGSDFRLGYFLQRMLVYPAAANFLVRRAISSSMVAQYLGSVIGHSKPKRALFSPSFLVRLFLPDNILPKDHATFDNRQYPRVPCALESYADGHVFRAINIGLAGVRFFADFLPKKSHITFTLKNTQGVTPSTYDGQIVWSKGVSRSAGQYQLGVKFQNVKYEQQNKLLHFICDLDRTK